MSKFRGKITQLQVEQVCLFVWLYLMKTKDDIIEKWYPLEDKMISEYHVANLFAYIVEQYFPWIKWNGKIGLMSSVLEDSWGSVPEKKKIGFL